MHRVVVEDPIKELKQGEILEGELAIRRAAGRGVVLLPVDPDFQGWGVDGFSFRAFGRGCLFAASQAHRGGSVVMRVASQRPYLYWVAAVRPADPELPWSGSIKLTADTSRGDNGVGFGVEVPARRLEEFSLGRTVVGGRLRLSSVASGYLGLSCFGLADNVLAEWLAVSQSTELADMLDVLGQRAYGG